MASSIFVKSMKISERFKQELQLGNFETAIEIAIEEAMTLEIITWVADDVENSSEISTNTRKPGQQILTKINLLDGKVENQIGKLFLDGEPYANLRSFHLQQVEASKDLIEQKVASLRLLKDAWSKINQQQGTDENLRDRTPADRTPADPNITPAVHSATTDATPSTDTTQDNIELILGNIFNSALSKLEPPSFNPALRPTQSSSEGLQRQFIPDVHAPENLNLQIDLSLDELLADLFTEEDESSPAELVAPDPVELPDFPAVLSATDPWEYKGAPVGYNAAEPVVERSPG